MKTRTSTCILSLLAIFSLSACEPATAPTLGAAATDIADSPESPTAEPASEGAHLPPGLPDTYPLADVEITLERTVCFGFCPVYTVTVFGDGRVVYEGQDHVAVKGRQERQIEREQVVELLRAFYEADFFQLRDAYREELSVEVSDDGTVTHSFGMVTDLPTYTVTLRIGDYEKRVVDYWKAPESLRELEDKIDELAGTGEWVEVDASEPTATFESAPAP